MAQAQQGVLEAWTFVPAELRYIQSQRRGWLGYGRDEKAGR